MKTGVALLNWNNTKDSIDCLASLKRLHVKPWKVAVLDNGSSKDSLTNLTRYCRRWKTVDVLTEARNTGFAVGNNILIRYLLKLGAEAIWILNNDTVVEENCLGVLQEQARHFSRLGCLGAYIYKFPNQKDPWYAGSTFNPWIFSADHKTKYSPPSPPSEVDFITGCSMFVPRRAFKEIGQFDPMYFAYSEDFDWCLRAKNAGLKLIYCPEAIVGHKVSSSINKNNQVFSGGKTSPAQQYLTNRNHFYVVRKHLKSPLKKSIALIYWLMKTLFLMGGTLLLCRFDKSKAIFKSIIHGLGDTINDRSEKKFLLNGVRL